MSPCYQTDSKEVPCALKGVRRSNRPMVALSIYLIHMGILPSCMSLYHMYAQYPQRPEEGAGSSGPGVTSSCVGAGN